MTPDTGRAASGTPDTGRTASGVPAYAGALLTSFYAAMDARDVDALAALLTPDVSWHLVMGEATTVTGRDAVQSWVGDLLGGFESLSQTVLAVHDEGTAAAVFTSAVSVRSGEESTTAWLDSFRFEDGFISEYVSLLVG